MEEEKLGAVKVSEEVVATIAGITAAEVEGVAGMSAGIIDGVVRIVTGTQLTKGVKAKVTGEEAELEISIVVNYGASIPTIAWKIQEGVKRNVEEMTGLRVNKVDVNVAGISLPEEEKARLKKSTTKEK